MEMEYTTTNAKGKATGSAITVIDKVSGANGNYDIIQTVTLYDSKGDQLTNPITSEVSVVDGNASIALGGGVAIEVSNAPLIPSRLDVGTELQCGEITINVNGLNVKQDITFNKVVAREEITTTAGTFDCYVVEQNYVTKLGPIKVEGVQKTWYARGVGNVKTETYDKKGKVASIQTLTALATK